ncbi:hypothetical protein D9M73_119910 [compost metagenome]
MAKGNCIDSTTWLTTSNSTVSLPPVAEITISAGMIASERVTRRRSHGRTRMRRNPSITICPASVPVMVLDCPDASNASANAVAAAPPSAGRSNWWASCNSVTTTPLRQNTAAASTRIAALTKNAAPSASTVSTVLNASAALMSRTPLPKARVCTIAECRYKLCGITVAPRIPSATIKAA